MPVKQKAKKEPLPVLMVKLRELKNILEHISVVRGDSSLPKAKRIVDFMLNTFEVE